MGEQHISGASLHVIVTRFNVNIATTKTKEVARINPAVDASYLDRRFTLFERYTVPSIQGQTNQNFIWVVLFHADTPQPYKDKLAALQQAYPVFRPLYVPHEKDHVEALNEYLIGLGATQYVISRIDNDDAFHTQFVHQVQDTVAQQGDEREYVIIYPYGVQYHENRRIAAKYDFPLNHFSTLVTEYQGDGVLKNIITYNHMKIGESFALKQIALDTPMWLEVIHDSNITNRMHVERKQIVRDAATLHGFGMALPIAKNAYWIASLYAAFKLPINAVRLLKMYGVKGCIGKVAEKLKH